MKRSFLDQRVLITGAASGIGRATARHFAELGARVIACDIDGAGLASLARELSQAGASNAETHTVDVGQRAAMQAFSTNVLAGGAPDVLVNNAGVGLAGGFLATTLEDWDWILSANLWGVVHGCHFFAPAMAARGRGQIVNVASAAGYYSSSAMAAYGTTKYAVVGLSEALRDELARRGVGVSVVCPGFVDTPIVRHMRMRGDRYPESARADIARFYRKRAYGPERVAAAIARAALENPALLPVTAEAWGLYWLKRAVPTLLPRIARAVAVRTQGRNKG
ncbi:MAG TPA: SDR family NAD(P)-dependent oxidoreductase [Polyangiaceae bacterium]|jgi:NAD(P)-dependent dehydrogenase (short-subunit alcohol dehydrogenase family)